MDQLSHSAHTARAPCQGVPVPADPGGSGTARGCDIGVTCSTSSPRERLGVVALRSGCSSPPCVLAASQWVCGNGAQETSRTGRASHRVPDSWGGGAPTMACPRGTGGGETWPPPCPRRTPAPCCKGSGGSCLAGAQEPEAQPVPGAQGCTRGKHTTLWACSERQPLPALRSGTWSATTP